MSKALMIFVANMPCLVLLVSSVWSLFAGHENFAIGFLVTGALMYPDDHFKVDDANAKEAASMRAALAKVKGIANEMLGAAGNDSLNNAHDAQRVSHWAESLEDAVGEFVKD